MAQMDLMVGLVARYAGAEVAEGCTRRMVLDERRSQVPYMAIGLWLAPERRGWRAPPPGHARVWASGSG